MFGETLITGFSVYYESQGYVFPSDNYVSLTIVRAVTPSACAAGVKDDGKGKRRVWNTWR